MADVALFAPADTKQGLAPFLWCSHRSEAVASNACPVADGRRNTNVMIDHAGTLKAGESHARGPIHGSPASHCGRLVPPHVADPYRLLL